MRRMILVLALAAVALTAWGCIQDIQPKYDSNPRVWFTRAPADRGVIYDNAATFEWVAVDTDDDLGMGKTFVRLTPTSVDTIVVFPHELEQGWVRVYKPATNEYWGYDISNLPDTVYTFSVKVVDGRGGETITSRRFTVRFDNEPPIVDSVACPPMKPTNPNFTWTYVIYAHDVAANMSAATPVDSLCYTYRFSVPGGGESIEASDCKRENKTFTATVDGQQFPGQYKFKCKATDRAGNSSEEFTCTFDVGSTGPK
ncbi:MAG TPA: hypothetical protein VMU02_06105 [bacterium]|nr:hypothetical protein [bacterium]